MQGDPKDWITVAALPALGAVSIKRLWEAGWTPEKILSADEPEWQRLGLKPKTISALSAIKSRSYSPIEKTLDEAFEWQEKTDNAQIISVTDPEYPSLLREIADPPPVLFCQGNHNLLNLPQLAVVGSRNPSSTGLRNAYQFSAFLSQSGLAINSGLALGVDAAAHQGCVDHKGPTLAVFGTGIDKLYPARNRNLASQILDTGGVWVSEFFPGTPPVAGNFPKRNRIISGMSSGVLIVEAAIKSGSLITARMALEQNREVFAIPGPLNNPLSKGCHKLIKEGAVLVENADEIVAEIGQLLGSFQEKDGVEDVIERKAHTEPLSASEDIVLHIIGYEVCDLDKIALEAGLDIQELMRSLVTLELKGLIAQSSGGYLRL